MRFTEFLRITVLISAGAATALAAVTVAAAANNGDDAVVGVGGVWWMIATAIGVWLGRGPQATRPIASLLAGARTQTSLPDVQPGRVVLNRLWPLLVSTVLAGAVAFVLPQLAAIATGFAIICALAWRRQSSAVRAIEERDGARFYVERTPPLGPMRLVRTPGFRSNLFELNGASGRAGATQPRI
jgi:hypothetical protein